MWQGKNGPCTCFFCERDLPHRDHRGLDGQVVWEWRSRGHLQVAESLDKADVLLTKICSICTHEENV